jgi:SAM-dependent methyltransferase
VQTTTKVIERCMLMTTDPGDLVLDPTCGSGTTAFVAEKWGRRWITCDTSRVALALAKQRLMTATFDHFQLRELTPEDVLRNPRGAWLRNGTARAQDLCLQDRAAHHAQEHRAQHGARSAFCQARAAAGR